MSEFIGYLWDVVQLSCTILVVMYAIVAFENRRKK